MKNYFSVIAMTVIMLSFFSVSHAEDDFVANIQKETYSIATEISNRTAMQDEMLGQATKEAKLGTLKNPEDIERRIRVMERVVALSEEAVAIIKAAPALIAMSESFKNKSTEEKERAMGVVKDSLSELKIDILVKKLQTDRSWALTQIKRFKLLKDNPSSWRYDESKGFIDSSDENFIKRFNELTTEINRLQDRATELTKKYLGK